MRIRSHSCPSAGNVLIVVIMTTGLVTASVAGYLALTTRQNESVMRSLCWNAALPLAEAGVEEALSHLHKNSTNWGADGWTLSGTNYTKQRPLGDSYYTVNVSGFPVTPGIPVRVLATGSSLWRDTNYLSRTVQVTAEVFPLPLASGLVANSISFGGDLQVDSYDSANPFFSTGGNYDPAKATDLALVATAGSGFTLGGNSHVFGYVASGPGGTVTTSGSAAVGDKSYAAKGIEAGHFTNNFTLLMPDVVPPYQFGYPPLTGSVNGTNYNYILDGGKFMIANLDAGGSATTLYVGAPSILYVTGNLQLSLIVFAPGAQLALYMGAPSISIAPVVVGATPPQFTLWCLPSCTSLTLNGSTVLYGVIYAPETALKAAGGASILGAIMCQSFTCSGTFNFHFDSATARAVPSSLLTLLSWDEL
jgi:hypothetical protein